MALDERFNARKYLEYKLMMGFDERYAITRPVGDWKSIPTLYIEDIKPEPVVQQPEIKRRASFYPNYRRTEGGKKDSYPVDAAARRNSLTKKPTGNQIYIE